VKTGKTNHPLVRFRKKNLLTRVALAKKAGLAKVTLAAIETLSATPHAGTVERLNRLSPSLGSRCLLFHLLAQIKKVRATLRASAGITERLVSYVSGARREEVLDDPA
jgi:DNA-binding XRE family transcriptional regulator